MSAPLECVLILIGTLTVLFPGVKLALTKVTSIGVVGWVTEPSVNATLVVIPEVLVIWLIPVNCNGVVEPPI